MFLQGDRGKKSLIRCLGGQDEMTDFCGPHKGGRYSLGPCAWSSTYFTDLNYNWPCSCKTLFFFKVDKWKCFSDVMQSRERRFGMWWFRARSESMGHNPYLITYQLCDTRQATCPLSTCIHICKIHGDNGIRFFMSSECFIYNRW